MKEEYIIITDSCSDLPYTYAIEKGMEVVPLNLSIGDRTFKDDLGQSITHQEFFQEIDNGALPMTSQPTPEAFYQAFKKGVAEGKSVLYIGVSSGLSGTFNSANIGKQMVEEEYPDAHIVCFTTLIASLGQALFVMKAMEMQSEGKTLDKLLTFLNEKVTSQKNLILMNDLSHLKRGGRISGFQSAIGSILKINPVIKINQEGKVEEVDKIRGRNKGIKKLVEYVIEHIKNPENQTIAISHSEAWGDVEKLKSEISSRIQVQEFLVESIGPVVGSYSGTGTVAVFFLN